MLQAPSQPLGVVGGSAAALPGRGLLRCSIACHAEADLGPLLRSDGDAEFLECGGQPGPQRCVDSKLVVAAS
jgi:hypothetical protein